MSIFKEIKHVVELVSRYKPLLCNSWIVSLDNLPDNLPDEASPGETGSAS